MSDIRMADGSINLEGEWLTADDLRRKIQEKMDAGDMRFAGMAAALQELSEALESAHTLEVKIILTKTDYDKLRAMGGDDDNASVRKAIRAFVGGGKPKAEAKPAAETIPVMEQPRETEDTIPCTKCKTPIPIPTSARPLELECEFCGTSVLLPVEEKTPEPAAPPETAEPSEALSDAAGEDKPDVSEEKSEPKRTDHFIG